MGKATAHGKGVLSTLRSVYGADEYVTEDTRGRLVKEMEELSWNGRLKMQGLFRHGVDKLQNACMERKAVNGCFCKAVFPVR